MQDWEEGDGKYVAPELLNGQVEPTPAADIYSLGATLYESATGGIAATVASSINTPSRVLQLTISFEQVSITLCMQ